MATIISDQQICSDLLLVNRIARANRMNVEWGKNARCWTRTTGTDYPRFEAWSSNGSIDDQWCLRVILNPGERPIEVSRLRSFDEVEQLAEGMLMVLDRCPYRKFPSGHKGLSRALRLGHRHAVVQEEITDLEFHRSLFVLHE